jgi:deoxycytidylate deaminase
MSSALQVVDKEINIQENKGKNTKEKIENTLTEELFFSVCSPIGSLKENAIKELKKKLEEDYKYNVRIIKLSDFIEQYKTEEYEALQGKTEIFSQYNFKINEGNKLRDKYTNQILAELSIADIHAERAASVGIGHLTDRNYTSRRNCYIFDSIKNKEELRLLRSVYTDNFFQISIFSPLEERIDNLISKGFSSPEANEIIEIDDYQNIDSGQNVRGTFVESDFFLRISKENIKNIDSRIERYLHLIFESKVITPTIEETSMFYAKSAANNSSCLSRQVGASITDENGNLLSTGWNDVPKYGGNLYRDGMKNDDRCFTKGYCTNDKQKDELTENISEILIEDDDIKKLFQVDGKFDLVKFNNFKGKIRNSKVKDLIEFSRSVHAEMHAIILGSQITGSQMIKGKLYCTTYPCHNCARHIILSGIREVYYIEPYVKSLCLKLHDDSITESEIEDNKVKILIFDGVAPRRYQIFFTNFGERKNKNGDLRVNSLDLSKPKVTKSLQALPELERQAIHSLKQYGIIND